MDNIPQQHAQYFVVGSLPWNVMLGMPQLQAYNPQIDWQSFVMQFQDGKSVQGVPTDAKAKHPRVESVSAKMIAKLLRKDSTHGWLSIYKNTDNMQTQLLSTVLGTDNPFQSVQQPYRDIVQQYQEEFAEPRAPLQHSVKHRIDFIGEAALPPRPRQYHMLPAELAEVRRQLDDMLERGQIKPWCFPYGHHILFVSKRTGKLCMCVDYRLLNKNTRLDCYPIPRIDDLLDRLAKAKCFTKIDLENAYHQVEIELSHTFKIAFQSRFGLYEYIVILIGLCNSPATFKRLMHKVFDKGFDCFVLVYLDDILTFSETKQKPLKHIEWVFKQLKDNNLKAELKISTFGIDTVDYLRHKITNGTIVADLEKTAAISHCPKPQTIEQLQKFLGLANQYNRFEKISQKLLLP